MFDRIVRRSLLLSFALMALLTGCGVSSTPHSQTRLQAGPCTLAAGSALSYAQVRTGLIDTLNQDQADTDSTILAYAAPLKGQSVAWQGNHVINALCHCLSCPVYSLPHHPTAWPTRATAPTTGIGSSPRWPVGGRHRYPPAPQ